MGHDVQASIVSAYSLKHIMNSCRTHILERCLRRLEWEKAKEAEAQAAADKAEAERLAMQAIDWWGPKPSPAWVSRTSDLAELDKPSLFMGDLASPIRGALTAGSANDAGDFWAQRHVLRTRIRVCWRHPNLPMSAICRLGMLVALLLLKVAAEQEAEHVVLSAGIDKLANLHASSARHLHSSAWSSVKPTIMVFCDRPSNCSQP